MRTKALLGLAALAVGLSTSVAQNVYSLNVVGYVNVTLQANKAHLLSIPLAPVDGNFNITNTIILDSGDGTQDFSELFAWAGTAWSSPATWFTGAWDTPMVVSNGVAYFLLANANSTLTFVGQVPQGALAYNIPVGVSTLANQVPVTGPFPGATVGNDFDEIFTWNQASQSWASPATYFSGAWDSADPNGPVLNPGQGAFYLNTGAAIPFTQNFTVQ
jgi:hypothetical protein